MTSPVLGRRRSSMEIVHRILSVCAEGGCTKTTIMYRSNLSYQQLQRYLSLLFSQQLIEEDEVGLYQITVPGKKTMRQVARVIRSLST